MTNRKTFLALVLTVMCAGLMFAGEQNRLAVDAIDSNHPVVLVPQSQERTVTNPPSTEATLYSNGPLVTHPGGGFGGADASALESPLTVYGFGHQGTLNYSVADDFTVTDDGGWTVDELCFYGYQTGSSTVSTFTAVQWTIWDGDPSLGGATAVCSDSSTVAGGTLATGWSGMYRTLTTDLLTATTRPVMLNTVTTGGCVLAAGTYWVEWKSWGTLASGPWCPPVTILGTYVTGDGLQNQAGLWVDLLSGTTYAQGVPFEVKGTVLSPNAIVEAKVIPESGDGAFELGFRITNASTTDIEADFWVELTSPQGVTKVLILNEDITLPAGESFHRRRDQELKDGSTAGPYTFVVKIGTYPDSAISSASTVYTKTDSASSATSQLGERATNIVEGVPSEFSLNQNYPNPFNPVTTISYQLPDDAHVSLIVSDVSGKVVATLVNGREEAGYKSVTFDGSNLASGIYFYRLQAGSVVETRKLMLLR